MAGGRKTRDDRELYEIDQHGCWVFIGSKSHNGYGQMKRGGKHFRATHYFLRKMLGTVVPAGMHVDHLCRNVACVNPEHLEVVTSSENVRRGRVAKLSQELVSEIRTLYESGGHVQSKLGAMFGVGQDEISRIVNGKRWI